MNLHTKLSSLSITSIALVLAIGAASPGRAAEPTPPEPTPTEPAPLEPEPLVPEPAEPPPELIAPPSEPAPEPLGTSDDSMLMASVPASETTAPPMFVIGLKLGGAINLFNSLGASFTPELELGVLLPPLDRAFEIFIAGRWAAPSDEGESAADPRLPGDGVATWSVTRSEVALGLGLRFRVPLDGIFKPYLAAGVRLYLLATEVSGEAGGESFGTNEETGTALGFLAQLGGEVALGPGAILLELAINGAALDQTILADTNASSLDVYLGYRFMF